jgi:serine/threonine-protein phosphatase 2A regulatory subunit A
MVSSLWLFPSTELILVIGVDRLSQAILPAVMELSEDKQWRVRQAIIEYIPLIATQLGVQFFDDQLGALCMTWLGDTVFSIREAATINLKKLTDVFGVEWAKQTIIPKVMDMREHPNYLYRMTTIFAITVSLAMSRLAGLDRKERKAGTDIQTMAPSLDVAVIRDTVLDAALALSTDPIPNIRFNVAKCLETLAVQCTNDAEGQDIIHRRIVPALKKLQEEDTDADVRYVPFPLACQKDRS